MNSSNCPVCNSTNFFSSYADLPIIDNEVDVICFCNHCHSSWDLTYKLYNQKITEYGLTKIQLSFIDSFTNNFYQHDLCEFKYFFDNLRLGNLEDLDKEINNAWGLWCDARGLK